MFAGENERGRTDAGQCRVHIEASQHAEGGGHADGIAGEAAGLDLLEPFGIGSQHRRI